MSLVSNASATVTELEALLEPERDAAEDAELSTPALLNLTTGGAEPANITEPMTMAWLPLASHDESHQQGENHPTLARGVVDALLGNLPAGGDNRTEVESDLESSLDSLVDASFDSKTQKRPPANLPVAAQGSMKGGASASRSNILEALRGVKRSETSIDLLVPSLFAENSPLSTPIDPAPPSAEPAATPTSEKASPLTRGNLLGILRGATSNETQAPSDDLAGLLADDASSTPMTDAALASGTRVISGLEAATSSSPKAGRGSRGNLLEAIRTSSR